MSKGVALMGKLKATIQVIYRLKMLIHANITQGTAYTSTLMDLIRDAHRFIMSHKVAIEKGPLQVYVSALVFSPTRSLTKGLFKREEPN
jgi:hypothetical protein